MNRHPNKHGRGNVWFDWRIMGIQAYVPLAAWILLILYCAVFRQGDTWSLAQQLPVLEMMLPVFSAWWSICLFQDVLEEEGSETLFSYPISRWKLGTARVLFFCLLYMGGIAAVLGVLQSWTGEPFWLSLTMQFSAQAVFFSSLGFLAVVAAAQVGWALLIVAGYAVIEQFIGPMLPSFLNIYFFNRSPLSPEQWWLLAKPLGYGLALMAIAQILLHHFRRFR